MHETLFSSGVPRLSDKRKEIVRSLNSNHPGFKERSKVTKNLREMKKSWIKKTIKTSSKQVNNNKWNLTQCQLGRREFKRKNIRIFLSNKLFTKPKSGQRSQKMKCEWVRVLLLIKSRNESRTCLCLRRQK